MDEWREMVHRQAFHVTLTIDAAMTEPFFHGTPLVQGKVVAGRGVFSGSIRLPEDCHGVTICQTSVPFSDFILFETCETPGARFGIIDLRLPRAPLLTLRIACRALRGMTGTILEAIALKMGCSLRTPFGIGLFAVCGMILAITKDFGVMIGQAILLLLGKKSLTIGEIIGALCRPAFCTMRDIIGPSFGLYGVTIGEIPRMFIGFDGFWICGQSPNLRRWSGCGVRQPAGNGLVRVHSLAARKEYNI